MSAEIIGIAVYPLKKFKEFENKKLQEVPTKCDVKSVPCNKEVNIRMDPNFEYHMVCAVRCDNNPEIKKYSVKGSIRRTFGPLIDDKELDEKELNTTLKDIRGHYRQWWSWDTKIRDWTQNGRYDVTLILSNKKDDTKEEIIIPVTFSKPDYDKLGYDIDHPMC